MLDQMTNMRRCFHRLAESGWLEVRTTLSIIQQLKKLGFDIRYGKEIHGTRMGLPTEEEREQYLSSLTLQEDFPKLDEIKAGFTGAVACWDTGKPGKHFAFRVDIDANDVQEVYDVIHRPFREGFASEYKGFMHACGHDGHTTIGLFLARYIAENTEQLTGRYTIVFQPAEEGVRGAKSMVEKEVLKDVDYFFSGHLAMNLKSNQLGIGTTNFLATRKVDAHFKGKSAHAAGAPEEGRNALLCAASASLTLASLPQYGYGMSRVNVGVLRAGSGRNVVASEASMKLELRGEFESIAQDLYERATQCLKATGQAFGVEVRVEDAGAAPAYYSEDDEFIEYARKLFEKDHEIVIKPDLGGSEDVAYFLNAAEAQGAKTLHFIFGSDRTAAHHNDHFDFDEESMLMAYQVFVKLIESLQAS